MNSRVVSASTLGLSILLGSSLFGACDVVGSDGADGNLGGESSAGGSVAAGGGTVSPSGGQGGENLGGGGGEVSQGGAPSGGQANTDNDGCHPKVRIVLQRSGAMFQSPAADDNWWDAIAAALDSKSDDLLDTYASQVDLSLATFFSTETGAECLESTVVASVGADDLQKPLASEGKAHKALADAQVKVDAPVVEAIAAAAESLGTEGDRYLLLVASSIPDSCESQDSMCTAEDVFSALVEAEAAGVQTRVMYLNDNGASGIPDNYAQGLANAGAGLGVGNIGCNGGFEYSDQPGHAPFAHPESTDDVKAALDGLLGDIAACN